MGCGNINPDIRSKETNRCFEALAYVPLGDWVDDKNSGLLQRRCYHISMDITLERLKIAARVGAMMADPCGNIRRVHTLCASQIADRPEQQLAAGVSQNASPITVAVTANFGDGFRHRIRTARDILSAIEEVNRLVDPLNLLRYTDVSRQSQLNGVDKPFWRDWDLAEPAQFLTPDALHQWHRFIYDHVIKWARVLLGDKEVDFRISVIQQRVGYRHFWKGITGFKQVGGREQRDMARYILTVMFSHPAVPGPVIRSLRGLLDFVYLGQYMSHDDDTVELMDEALSAFHGDKQAILDSGARRGKNGPLEDFNIPKVEMLSHVAPSIKEMGVAMQYTSDYTEKMLIEVAKKTFRLTNHKDAPPQMVRALDRASKLATFSGYLAWTEANDPEFWKTATINRLR